MEPIYEKELKEDIFQPFLSDCKNCSGLCCVALYFSKLDGFPEDKDAGTPCTKLCGDFRCSIHSQLTGLRMKGCISYECLGAGQTVTRAASEEGGWKEKGQVVFQAFLNTFQLHQILWYLIEATAMVPARTLRGEAQRLLFQGKELSERSLKDLAGLDGTLAKYREQVNAVLKETGRLTAKFCGKKTGRRKEMDCMGRSFRGKNLEGRDFGMTFLIASDLRGACLRGANFLGADMRDADLRDTDLSESIFLTPGQIHSARRNEGTVLPPGLLALERV